MSLRSRILLLAVLPILIVGIVVMWIVERDARARILAQTERRASRELELVERQLEWLLEERLESLRSLAASDEVRSGDPETVLPALAAAQELHARSFERIYWVDLEGRATNADHEVFYVGDRDYYHDLEQGLDISASLIRSRDTGRRVVGVGVPVRDAAGARVGSIGGSMRIEEVMDALVGAAEPLVVLDAQGDLVAASEEAVPASGLALALALRGVEPAGGLQPLDAASAPDLLARVDRFERLGWTLASIVPRAELFADVDRARRLAILVTAAGLVIALGIAWLCSTAVVRPLDTLVEGLRGFRLEGDRSHVLVPRSGGGEVVRLAAAFDAMRSRLEREAEQRKSAERALLQAQRIESLGMLAGGLAHDVNNLLTVASASASSIRKHTAEPRVLAAVDAIESMVERGTSLTRRILAFARDQPIELRVVDLRGPVKKLEVVLRRLLPETAALAVEVGPEPCLARVDVGQIEQVLINLVVNARDAVHGRGRIDVRADVVHVDRTYSRLVGRVQAGAYARLVVCDDGVGMDPATAGKALEPFFTTKEAGFGTGLGLAVCNMIVRALGGHLGIDSAEGYGTVVTLLLPAVSAAADDVEEPAPAVPGEHGLSVLLAEDDEHVRASVAALLRGQGHQVRAFESGEECWIWSTGHPEAAVDLLITDVVMPGVEGPELARRLRAQRPGIRVLYVSGYAPRPEIEGEPLLRKPFHADQLARAVLDLRAAPARR